MTLAGHGTILVPMAGSVTDAVRKAMDKAPGSLRALAKAADVPHSTLVRIRSGERTATRDVAVKVAEALGLWGGKCLGGFEAINRTLKRRGRA